MPATSLRQSPLLPVALLVASVASCHSLRIREKDNAGKEWRKESPTLPGQILGVGGSLYGEQLFACGQNGLLLRSSDRGKTWRALQSEAKGDLFSVWQSLSGDVFASGEGGALLRSTDNGASWRSIELDTKEPLYKILGVHRGDQSEPNRKDLPERVLVVGGDGTILASDDGLSWSPVYGGTSWALRALWEDDLHVYIAGEFGTLLSSNDHGLTWESIDTGTQNTLTSVYSNNTDTLLLAGDRLSLERGGSGFLSIGNTTGSLWGTQDTAFLAQDGQLLSRSNGSVLWEPLFEGHNEEIEGIWGRSEDELYLWTDSGAFYLQDKDQTTLQSMQINEDLTGIFASTQGTFVLGENGTILVKKKGRWERQSLIEDPTQKLYNFWEEPGGLRLIVGQSGIVSSSFDSRTWESELYTPQPMYGIFGDPSVGIIAVGAEGYVVKTNDAGATWKELTLESTQRADLFGGTVAPNGDIFLVGSEATILRSQDHGQTFERLWLPVELGFDVRDIFSITSDPDGNLWISGYGEAYYSDRDLHRKARPDAIVWKIPRGDVSAATMVVIETGSMARSIFRAPDRRVYVVAKRSVASTTDGSSWRLELEENNPLTAIGGDNSRLYVVGLSGTIWSK